MAGTVANKRSEMMNVFRKGRTCPLRVLAILEFIFARSILFAFQPCADRLKSLSYIFEGELRRMQLFCVDFA